MEDYKPNSHKSKEESQDIPLERRIEKVGQGRTRKKSGIVKFADVFLAEDVSNVKSYVVGDVLIPAVKKLFFDIVTGGLDMVLYGGRGQKSKGYGLGSKVNYNSLYGGDRRMPSEPRSRSKFQYDDIEFDTRGEADYALELMRGAIAQYGFVTVADMYDMADITAPFTSNKYGWTDLRTAEVERVFGGGYIIKLPKAVPLN